MRVLMLGWSFSPRVSGGVGVACLGLTRGLVRRGVDVVFLMPERPGSLRFESLATIRSDAGDGQADARLYAMQQAILDPLAAETQGRETQRARGVATFKSLPSYLDSPYLHRSHDAWPALETQAAASSASPSRQDPSGLTTSPAATSTSQVTGAAPRLTSRKLGAFDVEPPVFTYGDTDVLFAQAMQYTRLCVEAARGCEFDVIHAHDWLTFPAAMAVAADSRKPLVVQLHSTESDRVGPGDAGDGQIREFERRAVRAADHVIVASRHLASIIARDYGDLGDKGSIIHHGATQGHATHATSEATVAHTVAADASGLFAKLDAQFAGYDVVVFAGRITMQKGARFFIEAASKVLAQQQRVVFVMAGSGDQMPAIKEQAIREGIADQVLLPGYMSQAELSRLFERASVFVMPSVSEPFGLAALEAMNAEVPVIVSNTSGVAEVVEHVLKVDFWDTDQIAAKIRAVLEHPDLAAGLRHHAITELKKLTWDAAAEQVLEVYRR